MRALLLVLAGCVPVGSVGLNEPPDEDADGVDAEEDCDDNDPRRAPGLDEICDGIDNDCDGVVDRLTCDRSESFTQTMRLDLLVVVDDTISMAEEQDSIAGSFVGLLDWVVGPDRDAHIGVITMDMDDPEEQGRLVSANGARFAQPSMSFAEASSWATEAITLGADPNFFDERGLDATLAALTDHQTGANTGFRREDAHLAVLYVSDENDEESQIDALELLDRVRSLPGARDFTVHAVVSDGPGCLQSTGEQYLALTALTGGLSQSICEADYGQFLSAVGQVSAQQGLSDTFVLGEPAQPDSIEVAYTVAGLKVPLAPEDFVLLDQHQVVFRVPAPPAGAVVTIDYSVLDPQ